MAFPSFSPCLCVTRIVLYSVKTTVYDPHCTVFRLNCYCITKLQYVDALEEYKKKRVKTLHKYDMMVGTYDGLGTRFLPSLLIKTCDKAKPKSGFPCLVSHNFLLVSVTSKPGLKGCSQFSIPDTKISIMKVSKM